jgi:hypothetical protein
MHGKGDRSIKEQIQRRLKPKGEATKIRKLNFANWNARFCKPDGPIFYEHI